MKRYGWYYDDGYVQDDGEDVWALIESAVSDAAYSRTRYMTTAAARITTLLERRDGRPAKGKRKASPGRPLKPAELKELGELERMAPDALVRGDSPPHASAVIGIQGDHGLFERLFRDLGGVVRGARVR